MKIQTVKIQTIAVLLFWGILTPLTAVCQHNSHHAHGVGHMTLVLDNGHLLVEMETPAANILGFEHKPNSASQWNTLEDLSIQLKQANDFIVLSPACQLETSAVDMPYTHININEGDKPSSPAVHKHHKTQTEHHSHQNKNSDADHSNILSRYEWRCNKAVQPKITLEYFKRYPAFNKITIEWIINGLQGTSQLNKSENILEASQ